MLLITFIPWIIFWVLLGLRQPEPAAVAGLVFAVVTAIYFLITGKSLRLLQLVSLVFFLTAAFFAFLVNLNDYILWVRISGSLLMSLAVFASIILRRPFTIQYSRELSIKIDKADARYLRLHYAISWAWCIVLASHMIIPTLRLYDFKLPIWVGPFFAIASIFAALKFTSWYIKQTPAL